MVMQKLNSGNSSKVLKILLSTLLFGALMGLVMADVGGFFRDGGTSRTDVARVGNETISSVEFARTYQRRLEQSGINPDIALQMNLPNMVLQQEVERQILLQAAHENGVRISDNFIATQLKKQLDTIQMTGTPQEKLQQVLMQQQLSEKQLVELLRGDFTINVLASAVTTGDMAVPEDMVLAAYRAEKQTRDADIITIPAKVAKAAALNDKAIEAYFNENKENYRTTETRDVEILVLPQSLFIKNIAVTDAEIEEFYKTHSDRFLSPERVRISQIITQSKDSATRIHDEKPQNLSSYQGDAVQFVDFDWYNKDGLPKEIADVVFKDKSAGLYGPVETSLGWHVLLVEKFEAPAPRALASVKSTIERQIKDEMLDSHMTEITNDIDTMVSEDAALKEIADKYKLQTIRVSGIDANNAKAKLQAANIADGVLPRVQEAVFTLDTDETSPLMDTASGDFALARITKLTPSAIPALKDVRDQVVKAATKAAGDKALQEFAENLLGKFNHDKPAAFDKAVKDAGLSVQTLNNASKSEVESRFSAETANLLFTLTPDNALSYTKQADVIKLVRLKTIRSSNATPSASEKDTIQDSLRTTMLQEVQQQFTQAWQDKLGLRVNQRLLQTMFTNNTEQ